MVIKARANGARAAVSMRRLCVELMLAIFFIRPYMPKLKARVRLIQGRAP